VLEAPLWTLEKSGMSSPEPPLDAFMGFLFLRLRARNYSVLFAPEGAARHGTRVM